MPLSVADEIHDSSPLVGHFRTGAGFPVFDVEGSLSREGALFSFGQDVVCYSRVAGPARPGPDGALPDVARRVALGDGSIRLPFDPKEVLDNLRYERYVNPSGRKSWIERSPIERAYYRLRPVLPVEIRRHLQRAYMNLRTNPAFPRWPLDRSADVLFERLLVLAMEAMGTDRAPFIWFWPEGHQAAAILTHDVETTEGRDFTPSLMDIDDAAGFRAAFQIVPEDRYDVPAGWVEAIRERGFEVNLHGLNHDGNLFASREAFLAQADRINAYAEAWGVRGFRSPSLYRNADWLGELHFAYDMSVPNVARYEAQLGGCCTVMPYFLPGGMLELPLTMSEDYTLFHILGDYSTRLWQRQAAEILAGHGLITILVHPDYVVEPRAQDVYRRLLEETSRLESENGVWMALPGEVDRWWRERSRMELVEGGDGWSVEGAGSERARVAFASRDGDRVVYEIPSD